jgi:hypothetical protein
VLAFDENSICVIQAKALAALSVDAQRPSTRLASNVTKDIRKGLGQLGGALGNIRSGAKLFRADGEPLEIPNHEKSLAHAIVLLFSRHGYARIGSSHRTVPGRKAFFNRLCQRWINVKIKGTGYIRSVVPRTQ